MQRQPNPFQGEEVIRTAWQSQVAKAARVPLLARLFAQSGNDLFPRFAESYEQLKTLPRRARRALQRQLARSSNLTRMVKAPSGRALQHKLAWSLAGAALLLALGQDVKAATINVTTNNPHFVLGDGKCSLFEAVISADNDVPYDACPTGAGADTINLPSGTHTIKTNYFDYIVGLPVVSTQITIQGSGNGAKISRSRTAPPSTLILTTTTGNLTLNNVTVTGGYGYLFPAGGILNQGSLTIAQNSKILKNKGRYGGAVYNYFGTLNAQYSTISGNSAYLGGGIYGIGSLAILQNSTITKNKAYYGGGTFSYVGVNIVTNSTISKNQAQFKYGYIAAGGGMFDIGFNGTYYNFTLLVNSTITGNKAGSKNQFRTYGAGALNLYYSYSYLINSVVSKNKGTAANYAGGGGVQNRWISFIYNSTIEKNNADTGGGLHNVNGAFAGVYYSTLSQNKTNNSAYLQQFGGGIDNTGGSYLRMFNSTVSGNKSKFGGGIDNYSALSLVINSTITKNIGKYGGGGISNIYGGLYLYEVLASGNKLPSTGYGREVADYGGLVVTGFYNLFGANGDSGTYGFAPGGADYVPVAGVKTPNILSPQLKDNGGVPNASGTANKTHALVAGSPAIDAAPCIFPIDQRGSPRPAGGNCDIGAFEGPP